MYKRTYPPRSTPLPENYSGVALLQKEEEVSSPSSEREKEEEAIPTYIKPPYDEKEAEEDEKACQDEQKSEPKREKPISDLFPNADMLLLAVAALLSQEGQQDNELLTILLLLLLWS